jgi:hypothetical protein
MARTRLLVLVAICTAAVVLGPATAPAGEPACTPIRGRVTDAATGLALSEVTSVEIHDSSGPYDGGATNAQSRWSACLPPESYTFFFHADSYRPEWYDDQPDQASATVVVAAGTAPIVVNAALTPRGRVLTGRVTSINGAPEDASVAIWYLTGLGWRSIDGLGTDHATGIWSFRAPWLGRYRVSAGVDHFWSRWYDGDARLRDAKVIVVTAATTLVRNVNIRVAYCSPLPVMCEPRGFNT